MNITASMIMRRAIAEYGGLEAMFYELPVEQKKGYYYLALRELLRELQAEFDELEWQSERRSIIESALRDLVRLIQASTIIWELWHIVCYSIFNIDNILELAQEPITIEAINQVIDGTDGIDCNQLIQADTSASDIYDSVKYYTEVFNMDNIEYSSEPTRPKPSGLTM